MLLAATTLTTLPVSFESTPSKRARSARAEKNEITMNLTITKKVSGQGKNLVIIIPRNLHAFISKGDLVRLDISKLEEERK